MSNPQITFWPMSTGAVFQLSDEVEKKVDSPPLTPSKYEIDEKIGFSTDSQGNVYKINLGPYEQFD